MNEKQIQKMIDKFPIQTICWKYITDYICMDDSLFIHIIKTFIDLFSSLEELKTFIRVVETLNDKREI